MTKEQLTEFSLILNEVAPDPFTLAVCAADMDSRINNDFCSDICDRVFDAIFIVSGKKTIDSDVRADITALFGMITNRAAYIVWAGILKRLKTSGLQKTIETVSNGITLISSDMEPIKEAQSDMVFCTMLRNKLAWKKELQ